MSLANSIEVGASGLSAQRKRLDVLLNNIANASVTKPAGEEPFRRKDVIFSSVEPGMSFGDIFDQASKGVEVSGIRTDTSEPESRYEPGHKHADKNGYVTYPNVNIMDEMANVMLASRSYEANLQAVNAAKEMQQKTLELLR